ncbi:MAG: flagellar basal-body rod protein FlgF [Candidatus Cloacimonetes bacterium]|nr:flagellar basal-body rod protein FlgF [Candidatus Cloacimonadota bacterium]
MVEGLYKNSASMQLLIDKMSAIGNNLANVSTNGYQRKGVFFRQLVAEEQALERNQIGLRNLHTENLTYNPHRFSPHVHTSCCRPRGMQRRLDGEIATFTDYSPGGMRQTGNPLDVALNGEGFFTVLTPDGVAYTRDGQFSLDATGNLVTSAGFFVQGEGGPVQITGGQVEIAPMGEIIVDNEVVNRLMIRNFDTEGLARVKDALYRPLHQSGGEPVESPGVMQGYLELSNVNIVREMVDMIAVQRHYDANGKVIRAHDETLRKSVNNVGK